MDADASGTGRAARAPRRSSGVPELSELLTAGELRAVRAQGAEDLDDMLRLTPLRYIVPGELRDLGALREGDDATVIVRVVGSQARRMKRRPGSILEVRVADENAQLTLTFFLPKDHIVRWHQEHLAPGTRIVVFGTVHFDARFHQGLPQITNPRYEPYDGSAEARARLMRPLPVYRLRKKAKQATLRSAYGKAVEFADQLTTILPPTVRAAEHLPTLPEAMRLIHTPQDMAETERGRRHLVFEEAFILQTIFAQRRAFDARTPAPALRASGPLQPLLDERLPFTLTASQAEVGEAIHHELARSRPTNVLLQGDVGSGKTVVALRAMLQAVDSGHQAVLLAPTEVLAEQHHRTILNLLGDLGRADHMHAHPDATRVRLLTGSQSVADRRRTLLDITSGEAGIIVGTHALLTESVEYAALGLVVIDEQHRFGVDHRRRLRTKGADGKNPHVIVMTATPIPRTAALATAGDLDVLSLTQSPGGRPGITTHVVHEEDPAWESRMWARTAEEIGAGRQAFVVCARIDEREETTDVEIMGEVFEDLPSGTDPGLEPRGVTQTAERLARRPQLRGARIGIMHGRLSAQEKQEVMDAMVAGELDLLVATTVIEVGVDLPNASVMVVMDAERFGISQLHQLRGRIGRGEHPGIAFFDTRAPHGSETSELLSKIAATTDGFELAEIDMRRRGTGDLVGEEQSGLHRTLEHLDVLRDEKIIARARGIAFDLVAGDVDLEDHPQLAAAVERRLRDADPNVERS